MDEDVDFKELVARSKGYSGADIASVCREAAMMPMRRRLLEGDINLEELAKIDHAEFEDAPIKMNDFLDALKNIQKSVG